MRNQKVLRFTLGTLMAAILLLMGFTPLGYLNVGPLAITFNVIPVAIAAVALGPAGGAAAGAVFGLTSFFQCIGIGGLSLLGSALFAISPVRAAVLCFVPRILDGLLLGFVFRLASRMIGGTAACFVTGFFAAALNTVFYMSALLLLFGSTPYMQALIDGRNLFLFVVAFVGGNAVAELISSTLLSGAVGAALLRARLIPQPVKKEKTA